MISDQFCVVTWLEGTKRYSMLMGYKPFLVLSHEGIPHGLFPLVSELLAGCLLAYRQDDWGSLCTDEW